MIINTRIFELCSGKYKNLSELAWAMGISVSQIYRVKEGERHINQKFIIGAMKAFPNHKLDDLFYLAPELPTVTTNYCYQDSTMRSTQEPAAKKNQRMESTQQALERFASVTSVTKEYGQHIKSHTSTIMSLNEASQELKKSARGSK